MSTYKSQIIQISLSIKREGALDGTLLIFCSGFMSLRDTLYLRSANIIGVRPSVEAMRTTESPKQARPPLHHGQSW
jgi:hypothetical protein